MSVPEGPGSPQPDACEGVSVQAVFRRVACLVPHLTAAEALASGRIFSVARECVGIPKRVTPEGNN